MAVDATYAGHAIHTDQPRAAGGAETATSPFDLFLASIANCMGFYALRFCQERNLATEGLGLTLEPLREGDAKRMTALRIAVELPREFPAKYRSAIERAIDYCAVKSQLLNPPRFELFEWRSGAVTNGDRKLRRSRLCGISVFSFRCARNFVTRGHDRCRA